MNKELQFTIPAGGSQEFTFQTGVAQIAVTNANGVEGGSSATYTAGENIQISEENVISATNTTYSAGDGIAISEQNVISNTAEGNTDIIAEEYDNEKTYAVGDYCIYNNKLYRCISPISPVYWYKIPQMFTSTLNFTNVSDEPQDCYVTVQSNGHWIMASAFQNQKVRIAGFSLSDFPLNSTYNGTESVGYYNGWDYYDASTIAQYFPNGGYASESAALADLFSRPYFDMSKWEEVTVCDELKNIKEDISTVDITTTESLAGFKYNDKDVYVKEVIFNNVAQNTNYNVNFDAVDIYKFEGYGVDTANHTWFYNIMSYGPGYNRNFDPPKVNVTGPDGRSNTDVHLIVFYTKIN